VTLSGEIDIFSSNELKTQLTGLFNQNSVHLYLYCRNLEFIDSTALGALVGVMKIVSKNGREMHIIGLRPGIKKLFRITNLDKIFILEEEENG
jgi:anti-sigma B factor antagonist